MPALPLSPASLLPVVLLAASLTLQPALPACPSRLELVAEPEEALPEVCLSPGLPTTFRFDAPLPPGAMQVKGRERLGDMPLGTHSFTVLPPEDLQPGERFEVAVHFPDGAAPTRATFSLVAHPAFAPRQVAVFRHPRTVEDYRKETQEEREKARRLGQEVAQLQAQQGPGGLTGALAAGVVPLDATGVLAKECTPEVTFPATNALAVNKAFSYRAKIPTQEGEQPLVRVALAMEARNMGTEPWQAHEAALVSKGQEVKKAKAWLRAPLAPGENGLLVVETELTGQEARGTFQLKVWDESGRRLVVLGNVTFPVTQ